VQLVRQARGAEMPDSFWTDPLMYQGASDGFLAPRDPIPLADPAWGLDLEAEVAVITGDVPKGADPATARAAVRLVMLANDISLRNLIPDEIAKGFGFFQGKPATAFSPVAVTPDELEGWRDGKLNGALEVELNGALVGQADAGVDMTFDFGVLIAHAARTRALSAGSIVGAGTVSNRGSDGGPGRTIKDGGAGYSCLAELRVVEALAHGAPRTPFLQGGDRVRIEMRDSRRHSIFGAIEQEVAEHEPALARRDAGVGVGA
jgi:fumarylacetoacetate (FAA) hydrolase